VSDRPLHAAGHDAPASSSSGPAEPADDSSRGADGGRTGTPMVEVRGLRRRFGARTVLDGADLTVAAGEFVAVEGSSGSGKSTLIQLLGALDSPDGGTMRVAGQDLTRLSRLTRYRRETVGLVFQLHNLIPRLSARQNVELAMFGALRSRTERRRRAEELLEIVGLTERIDSFPPKMSGGERQRVAFARALANHPKLLLADEPTGSLDPDSTETILATIETLRAEEGITVLAVSHDPLLNRAADRVLRLEDGHIVNPEQAKQTVELPLSEQLDALADLADREGLPQAAMWLREHEPSDQ
jgi:putative ABC transport system ATP-binding protein